MLSADLVLSNANVITLNDTQPSADVVAIAGDRIAWVGSGSELGESARRNAEVIDCQGQTLVPGFIDAHCHLLAYAASLVAVDCGPAAVASIDDIKHALRERACHTPAGQWVRGTGYNEFALREKRHPTRWDLDEAVHGHPVRLNHRSGHACVLNSAALARVGISTSTPEPMGGVIERDSETGEPTGLLMEMDDYLSRRVPSLSEHELRGGVHLANQRLLSLGITSVQDATHSNSIERWDTFTRLKAEGILKPRVTMMAGADHLDGFLERGLSFGSGDADLDLGAVKIMTSLTTGTLLPTPEELSARVRRASEAGFQVAVHAVEAEAVEAAAEALLDAQMQRPATEPHTRDRIEHCSECPDATMDRLAGSGLTVVTQPGFLYYSGERYLAEVAEERQPWLYRINAFFEAGLRPAAGSDAPVIDPNPLIGIYAAVTRRAKTGRVVGASEGVSVEQALKMYTINGAFAAFQEADKGSIEVGKLADLVLLDRDPTRVEPEQIRHVKATLNVIGGRVVWQA